MYLQVLAQLISLTQVPNWIGQRQQPTVFFVRYYISGTTNYLYKTVKPEHRWIQHSPVCIQIRCITGRFVPGVRMVQVVRIKTTPASFTTLNQSVSCVVPNLTVTGMITANTAATPGIHLSPDSFQVRYNVKEHNELCMAESSPALHIVWQLPLLPNTQYEWCVRCICASSPSQAYSAAVSFTTLSSSCGTADVYYFSSTSITSNSATVGWSWVVQRVYNIRYAVRYSGNWVTVSSTTVSKALSALASSTWYEFQVQSVCSSGAGTWSSSGIFKHCQSACSDSRTISPVINYQQYLHSLENKQREWHKGEIRNQCNNLNLAVSNSSSTTEHIIQIVGLAANTKYYYSVGTTTTTLQGDTGNYFITNPCSRIHRSSENLGIWWFWCCKQCTETGAWCLPELFRNHTHKCLVVVSDNAYSDGTDNEYQNNVFNMYPYQFKNSLCGQHRGIMIYIQQMQRIRQALALIISLCQKNGEAGGLCIRYWSIFLSITRTSILFLWNPMMPHFVLPMVRWQPGWQMIWMRTHNAGRLCISTILHIRKDRTTLTTKLSWWKCANIMPILEGKKVDLVMAGHSHSYERSMLLRGHYGVESTFNASTMAVNSGSGIYPSSYLKTAPNYYGTVYLVCGVGGQVGATTTDILTTRCIHLPLPIMVVW